MDMDNENIVLIDEDGSEIEFECLDYIELNDKKYVVLAEIGDEKEDDEEDEIVILEVVTEDGEDTFVTIEDDEEVDLVFDEFKSRIDEDVELTE